MTRIARLMMLSAISTLVVPVGVAAQSTGTQAAAGNTAGTSEIVVTGSRLRRSDATAATPVTVLTGAQLEATGKISLLDQLRTDPTIGTASRGTNFTIGGGGLERIDLRNVGDSRTLVLVNGHRYPFFSDIRGNSGQDIGTIPNAAIGRVDILRDGASALYGADAVAGVVNFITDTRFDGIEADAYAGISERGDLAARRLYLKGGKTFNRGSVTLTASWQHQDPLPQRNRDFATNLIGVGGIQASRTLIGSVVGPGGRVTTAAGALVACYPLQGGAALATAAACPRYDSSAEPSLLGGKDIYSGSAAVRYDLTDGIRFVADGIYSRRETRQSIGAQSLTSVSIAASNGNNPYGQRVLISDRLTDYGVRRFGGRSELYFGTAGFEGKIADRFDWSVTHTYGRTDSDLATSNVVNLTSVGALFNPQACAATAACAAVGPVSNVAAFLSKTTPLTAAQQGYLFYTERALVRFTSAQTLAQLSGPLFDLPAGPLQAVIGAEYRRESGSIAPDALSLAGASGSALAPTRGSFRAKEAFGELSLPILKDAVIARALDVDLVYRVSDFSNFSTASTWKAGVNWTITSDLRLRGSVGRSFRAPNILDLYNGQLQGTTNITDPCNAGPLRSGNATVAANCAALGVSQNYVQGSSTLPVQTGGNPNLMPERGMSYNIGGILTPRFIRDLTITVDWWKLKVTDAIGNRLQDNLNSCYADAGFQTRAANPADICYSFADRQSDGSLTRVNSLSTNFARLTTSGIDASLAYTVRGILGGDVSTRASAAYLIDYDNGDGNFAGTFSELVSGSSLPRWRVREELGYAVPAFQVRGAANFVSGMTDRNRGSVFTVPNAKGYDGITPDYVTFDLFAKVRVMPKMDLTVGVNNIGDRQPPYAYSALYNTLVSTYDLVGRYFYAEARVRF